MRAPLRIADAEGGQFPARLAYIFAGSQLRLVGKPDIVGEAELLVLLPVPIRGELQQTAKAAFGIIDRRCVRKGIGCAVRRSHFALVGRRKRTGVSPDSRSVSGMIGARRPPATRA